jgi:hypothetical protein
MNLKRRELLIAGVWSTVALHTGCATHALHKDHQYNEKVSSVLMSSDGKKIVVLSNNFHYIFDAPADLVKLLNSPLKKNVSANFGGFHVDGNNNINGQLNIVTDKNSSEDDKKEAIAIGFKPRPGDEPILGLNLRGNRYSADKFPNYADSHKLNREYSVFIVAKQSNMEKLAKAPLTPITVAIDGTLILSAIVLAPLLIPILLKSSCFPVCR